VGKKQSPQFSQIHKVARERFHFETLRPGQEEAISSVLDGRDTLVVQPTGSGKSAIYQIAGLLINGPTVVVSPLIALQKDQLDSIRDNDLADAAVVNSAQRTSELRDAFERLEEGSMEFLFLSPEQFANDETRTQVIRNKPSLFVIDEAHCISEWGHDFRPDYLKLGAVIDRLGHPPVLAMTATASPAVREEIIERLHMRNARVIVRGFDRPNIVLGVRTFATEKEKISHLLDAADDEAKPGIVYCATRKNVEEIAAALSDRGVKAVGYHGGMRTKEREQIQNEFMSSEQDVIVATNAFGMGVDKPDVRFVFHADISDSLDSYYQEIGRAGRDGQPARAILFYRPENLSVQKFLNGGGGLDEATVRQIAEAIHNGNSSVGLDELKKQTGLSGRKLAKAISRLEEQGVVKTLASGNVGPDGDAGVLSDAAKQAVEEQNRRREIEAIRLEKMRVYAELLSCRREYLMTYFGDEPPQKCHHCDNCMSPRTAAEMAALEEKRAANGTAKKGARTTSANPSGPYPENTRVMHKELGKGVVEGYEADKIIVLFDEAGRKTLSLKFVQEHDLLQPVTA
jgi:ATP-dependent DNA helicase RecQ